MAKTKFSKPTQYLHIILKSMFTQGGPGDVTTSIGAKQTFLFLVHGSYPVIGAKTLTIEMMTIRRSPHDLNQNACQFWGIWAPMSRSSLIARQERDLPRQA